MKLVLSLEKYLKIEETFDIPLKFKDSTKEIFENHLKLKVKFKKLWTTFEQTKITFV